MSRQEADRIDNLLARRIGGLFYSMPPATLVIKASCDNILNALLFKIRSVDLPPSQHCGISGVYYEHNRPSSEL
ncbi:hypothetical protein SAMN02745132_00068 [Enterovibrio nigricans DSM 22720]|uniref:Uncharacterized protein n=1 Tax=Enterovibrio nigricans DSM 22720 TaxID=1121868 RepID=A0A1T4TSL4_9GAMM|nr:hypothetical protein SAMN02745132_00068 [Enterovibrio nigricans DSM 22720]